MTALIAYRSPSGRVRLYTALNGVCIKMFEPGKEADEAWFRMDPVFRQDDAKWIDAAGLGRGVTGSKPEGGNEEMTKKTESPIVFDAQVEKPKVKHPRSGTWTKTSRQVPISGGTADLDMYVITFAGETLEVQRNRAGVKKANAWIRGMKKRSEQMVKIERIRKALLELADETEPHMISSYLRKAAELLIEDVFGDGDKEEGR